MTKMILLFTIAVVLFSAAAGASWYLQSQDAPPAGDKEEKSHKAAAPDPHHVKEVKLEVPARPLLRCAGFPRGRSPHAHGGYLAGATGVSAWA